MAEITQRRRATAWPERSGPRTRLGSLTAPAAAAPKLAPATLYRFVDGVDPEPRPMPAAHVARLNDPMATTFFAQHHFPLTITEVMTGLDNAATALDVKSFIVGEAGQIPPADAPELVRDFRFAVIRGTDSRADLMISTSAVDSSPDAFLQVAAWDAVTCRFNYYMRIEQAWVWSGDSYTALAPETRGRACFDSHVNGSVVMKELKQPWLHWNSMNSSILLSADDPLRENPLFLSPPLAGAEELESIVRAAVDRWTTARVDAIISEQQIEHPDWLLRQLLTTTTVNLASSAVEASLLASTPTFAPPITTWFNSEALLDIVSIPADVSPVEISSALYVDRLAAYDFALVDGNFREPGDSFFAFVVPEPAFEDLNLIDHLIQNEILPAKFVACSLMVDFPNPVYSPRRASLMAYCPPGPVPLHPPGQLAELMATAIASAAATLDSQTPEAEFAGYWSLSDGQWPQIFATMISDYFMAVRQRVSTSSGVDEVVLLSESRRRDFKATKLREFNLTLPDTKIPPDAVPLEMGSDGIVRPRPSGANE